MSLFKIKPGIEVKSTGLTQTEKSRLPEEAEIHVFCAAIAADYVKFIKAHVLARLDIPPKYTIRDLQVMTDIYDSDHLLTSADIVKNSNLDPATVARSVKTLKEFGHLETFRNQEDSRSRFLSPTPKGQALAEDYIANCTDVFSQEGLSRQSQGASEIAALLDILKSYHSKVTTLK